MKNKVLYVITYIVIFFNVAAICITENKYIVILCSALAIISGVMASINYANDKLKKDPLATIEPPGSVKVHKAEPVRVAFRFTEDPAFFGKSADARDIDDYIKLKGCYLMREQITDFIQYKITERVGETVIEGSVYVIKGDKND